MARLLDWPIGLRWNRMKQLTGPESVGASSSTTIGDMTQTVSSPFGARYMQFSFPPLKGVTARRARGLVTALHKGANAVRVSICDWDGLTLTDAGVVLSSQEKANGVPWGNGSSWDNGQNWKPSKPTVQVSAAAAKGTTLVTLSNSFWGRNLGMGDWIGFFPLHFGMYEITEDVGGGTYRIWPPLRKALTADSRATLYPVMVMRFLSTNLPDADRGPAFLEGLTMSFFEVFDDDVRDYFTD